MFQYCFCFMFWSLGSKAWEILAPKTGIEPVPPGMEGEVWTAELSGKSLNTCKFKMHFCQSPNSALVLDNMLISMENQKTEIASMSSSVTPWVWRDIHQRNVIHINSVILFFFFNYFFFIFKLYNIVLVLPNIEMNPPQVYMCSPFWTLLPPPSPYHPSGLSQCTSPKHPVSCIEPGLATHFIHDIIHVSMSFSKISPPSPSPQSP